jgi:hypothetical protein
LEVIDAFAARFTLSVNEMDGLDEHVSFKLPRQLRSA